MNLATSWEAGAAGGKMLAVAMNPQGYAGSYAAPDLDAGFAVRQGLLMHIAGGVVFGTAFGVLLLLAARLFTRGTIGWIATHASGTWSIGNNGMYLLIGSLYPFDDALVMTQEGVPRSILFVAGLALVLTFLALFTSFLEGIGLRREDSYWRWVLTVEAGLLLYLVMIAALRLLWPAEGQLPMAGKGLLLLACSPLVLLVLASCTYPLRRLFPRGDEPRTIEPCWATSSGVFVLGLLFMAAEVSLFSWG